MVVPSALLYLGVPITAYKTGQVDQAEAATSQNAVLNTVSNAYFPLDGSESSWQVEVSGVTNYYQSVVLSELIDRGVVTSPSDIDKYASVWKTGFNDRCIISTRTPTNEEIALAMDLMAAYSDDYIALVQDLTEKCRWGISTVSVMEVLESYLPNLEDMLVERVDSLFENDVAFCDPNSVMRLIPSRKIMEKILAGEYGVPFLILIQDHWDRISALLWNILRGEDFALYSELLSRAMEERLPLSQEKPQFSTCIMAIDLYDMSRTVLPLQITVIDSNRVLYVVKKGDRYVAGVINPQDISTMKLFLMRAFPQEDQYLLTYYPKMVYEGTNWRVSLNYEKRDQGYENVLGKINFDQGLPAAVASFEKAFGHEEAFYKEEREVFKGLLAPKLLEQIKAEPALEYDDIINLMLIMANQHCQEEAPRVFHISSAQYSRYEKRVIGILKSAQGLTREEFLVRAIAACDGRAALAAVISFNLLLPLGEIGSNSLSTRFPGAFRDLPGVEDQAGAIYHFFGCFFAAYALQRWMVDRYHNDGDFKDQMKEKLVKPDNQAKVFSTLADGTVNLKQSFDYLCALQYLYLGMGGEGKREIMSLAGVFFEEIFEDREVSLESAEDLRGVAAGHALASILSGVEILTNDLSRKLFVAGMESFVSKVQR